MTLLLLFGGAGAPIFTGPQAVLKASTLGAQATLSTRGGQSTLQTRGGQPSISTQGPTG
jgi:hypothetical protein